MSILYKPNHLLPPVEALCDVCFSEWIDAVEHGVRSHAAYPVAHWIATPANHYLTVCEHHYQIQSGGAA